MEKDTPCGHWLKEVKILLLVSNKEDYGKGGVVSYNDRGFSVPRKKIILFRRVLGIGLSSWIYWIISVFG